MEWIIEYTRQSVFARTSRAYATSESDAQRIAEGLKKLPHMGEVHIHPPASAPLSTEGIS